MDNRGAGVRAAGVCLAVASALPSALSVCLPSTRIWRAPVFVRVHRWSNDIYLMTFLTTTACIPPQTCRH